MRSGIWCTAGWWGISGRTNVKTVVTGTANGTKAMAAALFCTGKSSEGCSPCAQPLEIAAARHTVEHHAFAAGATSSTSNKNRIVTRRPTSS